VNHREYRQDKQCFPKSRGYRFALGVVLARGFTMTPAIGAMMGAGEGLRRIARWRAAIWQRRMMRSVHSHVAISPRFFG
jgi:hypothetical protein